MQHRNGFFARGLRCLVQMPQRRQQRCRALQDHFAACRGRQAASAASEQWKPEGVFDLLERLAQCGLRQMQRGGGLAQGAAAMQFHQQSKMPKAQA
ncbi:hypothetical protein D9M72_588270 [compost metagenome]